MIFAPAKPKAACMTRENPESIKEQSQTAAVQHLAEAHGLLRRLRERIDQHPESEQAIKELELALNKLTLRTGECSKSPARRLPSEQFLDIQFPILCGEALQ